LLTIVLGFALFAQAETPAEHLLVDFSAETLPACVVLHDTEMRRVAYEDGFAHEVRFHTVDWPNVFFQAPPGNWDWSAYAGVAASLYNPEDAPIDAAMRVDNAGADGVHHCNTVSGSVAPRSRCILRCYFNTGDAELFWGMRGVPVRGPLGGGPTLDTRNITAFQVFLQRPQHERTLLFERAWLFGKGGALREQVPFPFIDPFGQYKHADWPGKLHDESAFAERRREEETALAAAPRLTGRDRFGGWADGPRREATGWFRTEKVDGKWWLVTPEGTLFFSIGVNCVRPGDATFITGRDGWFAWLPEKDGPFAACLGRTSGVHSRAEAINGTGDTLNHFMANLIRAYGEDWAVRSRERALARLRAWGWNTVGNWSDGGILAESPIPFTVCGGSARPRAIAGSTGYWGKMTDVFDPAFAPQTREALRSLAERYRDNPLVIGYFVDNEMSWAGIARGALASPPDQPARAAFLEDLRAKYATVEQLNAAWETDAADWDSLQPPRAPNDACKTDFDAFEYRFARTYFDAVAGALRAFAPHQLYLGCRFTPAYCPPAALRACAETADVVSINAYVPEIDAHKYRDLGKPLLIGEFHFGALDRGMFHAGLQATDNQGARAAAYVRYVESVARHPMFVGCHWFQYFDQPVTGRSLDGENFNIGLVSIADAHYPELIDAARALHERVYTLRAAR